MRFGFIHRLMTDALAVFGILALVTSGELPRAVDISIVAGLVVALAIPERWQTHRFTKRASAIVPLALLAVQVFRLFAGASILEVAVEFAAVLQVVRLASRRGAAHDQQVIVLALLHLIAGTVLGGGLGYALCFLGFLIIAPAALVLSHLRREVEGNYRQGARDRTGLPVDVPRILRSRRVVDRPFLVATSLLSIPIFLFTASLFVLFPRVGLSLLMLGRTHSGRLVGFSDKVDLSEVGVLRSDPTIVMRVEVPDLPTPAPPRLALHLRGTAFDTYDGHSWSKSPVAKEPLPHDGMSVLWLRRSADPSRDRVMRVELEPIDPPVLFFPAGVTGIQVRQRGELSLGAKLFLVPGPEGELRYSGTDGRGLTYDLHLGPSPNVAPDPLSRADVPRYLTLPAMLPDRVRALAHTIVAGAPNASNAVKTKMVEDYLRQTYTYDLGSPSGGTPDPIDDFLFSSRRGHCEYYSTAMVLLLRELGIPARNVTGFIGGSYNRFGHYYAVRQGDAHSWVEAYLEDRGWTTFDPTPPSDAAPRTELSGWLSLVRDMIEASGERWDRYVVGYDLRQQVYLFEAFSRYTKGVRPVAGGAAPWIVRLLFVSALGAAGAFIVLWWRRRRRALGAEAKPTAATRAERDRAMATMLYEALDTAMHAQGIGRSTSTPPLRHAETLHAMGHPLADEILELTELYLDARFGTLRLSDDLLRTAEGRIKRVRVARPPRPAEPSLPP